MGCHTILGEGAYYAPELTKVYERRGPAFIKAMLRDPEAMYPGQRRMVKYDFTDEEMEAMVAFLKWIGEMDLNGFPPEPTLLPMAVQTPVAKDAAAAILRKHARMVHEVRLLLDKLRHQRLLRNRQTEGTDIDVDAVVDRYATVRGSQRPDDRLYLAQRRDLVTLLLIDMSASTDAWIEGSRVLDIATESALVLGEVLSQWGDRVGMAGFYSNTRRDCRFVMLKPFDADWHRSRAALTGLEPTGYTRIGPAVRHGTALLQGQRSARKLLLLLSDGKPIDYDRYEGRYGIADIRRAIREAHHSRIHTYALAIDVQAKLYLPQMFGSGSFRILPHPTHLVRGLSEVYGQLAR